MGGGQSQKVLIFVPILSGFLKGFLTEPGGAANQDVFFIEILFLKASQRYLWGVGNSIESELQ